MLRILGLAIVLSAGLAQAEEVNVAADRSVQSEQQVSRGFHPLKAIKRAHDHFVNLAIGLSSIGIDQPSNKPDHKLISSPLLSEMHPPACTNVQLTALLTSGTSAGSEN